jgi:hypothetical protein
MGKVHSVQSSPIGKIESCIRIGGCNFEGVCQFSLTLVVSSVSVMQRQKECGAMRSNSNDCLREAQNMFHLIELVQQNSKGKTA